MKRQFTAWVIINEKMLYVISWLLGVILIIPGISFCEEVTPDKIQKEPKVLKDRIIRPENDLSNKDCEIEALKKATRKHSEGLRDAEAESESGLLGNFTDRICMGGLIEVSAAHKASEDMDGNDDDAGDINLTTVEIGVGVKVNDWINLETVFLYEDPFNDEESSVDLDTGTVTLGNPKAGPFYVTVGKMFIPFGAFLTHLPDDPAVDQPMTLMLGESSEKAVLIGFENAGFSASAYIFNGDMGESDRDKIDSFGFDANYAFSEDSPFEIIVGASYISNIADSDGLTDTISENVGELTDTVRGMAAYLQLKFNDFFFDAEVMTAMDAFDHTELATANGGGAEPLVWNMEAGYKWNRGKNLEMVLKYAGSDETEALGFPKVRFGIGFNQEIFEGVIGSVAFFKDEYHRGDADGRDDGFTALGQIAVEF